MSSPPNPDNWITILSVLQAYIPAFMLLLPLLFQIVGIIGMIWYGMKIIRQNSVKYNLAPLIKSAILLGLGLFLNFIRQLL